jgi:signal transduction histidine kinase/ActR/RegA family two-component response regulator
VYVTAQDMIKPGHWMITRLLFRQVRIGWAATFLNAIFYYILARLYLRPEIINIWFASFLVIYFIRGILLWRISRKDDWGVVSPSVIRRRKLFFDIGMVPAGAIWGMLPVFLSANSPIEFQIFTILMLSGMTAGTMGSASYSLISLACFLVPSLTPLMLHFAVGSGPEYQLCTVMVCLYFLFLMLIGRNLRDHAVRALALMVEKNSITAARDEHEAASRAKSVFLARVSHEIRTPLAAVSGYTDLLISNPDLPLAMRRDLEVIARNGKHLTSLVNDLLDLGKIESGKIPIEKCWMSPIEQISDALQIIRSAAERKNLRIGVNYAKNIPDRIYSDPNRFHQIVLNLLTNAIKFTQKGTIRIEVKFDDQLRVLISDTGIGVPPDMVDKIFEPFVRGENQTAAVTQPGSGLGLALASDLAKCLGGQLRLVKTQLGVGTTFELTISSDQPPESLEKARQSGSLQQEMQSILANKHVLVVEDDPDLQELIRRQMFQLGANVDTCSNGAECLDHWSDENYDIILMDIQMPVMTGDLAARQLRQRGYKGPIIAVTAHGSIGDHRLAIDSGCTDYLSKPFELNTLLQVVARTLEPTA